LKATVPVSQAFLLKRNNPTTTTNVRTSGESYFHDTRFSEQELLVRYAVSDKRSRNIDNNARISRIASSTKTRSRPTLEGILSTTVSSLLLLSNNNTQKNKKNNRNRSKNTSDERWFSPPPGPPAVLPLLGTLPLIGLGKAIPQSGLSPPHVRMADLARDVYGDVMKLRMPEEWIVLSSPSAVHEAFVVKGKEFSGRPMVPSMKISSGNGKAFAQPSLTPELLKLRRTAFTSLFDAASVRRSHEQLEAEAQLFVDHLLASSSSSNDVEIRPALRRLVTNYILRYAFSTRVPFESEQRQRHSTETAANCDYYCPLCEELVDVTSEIWKILTSTETTMMDMLTPSQNFYQNPLLERQVRRRDNIIRKIISKRREERMMNSSNNKNDMLDALLGAGLPESDIHYTLVDLFVAGVNTVSTQLEWLLLLLAKNISIQEQARQSLVQQPSSSNQKNGKEERKGRENDLNNNNTDTKSSSSSEVPPYVRAVIKEVLRSKPPLLLPRKAVEESSTIGGYSIPKGTTIFVNNYALTHDDKWWNQPYAFRPERWLEEESTPKTGIDACKFIPYSIGRRVCPGSKLADAELLITTKVLLQNVKWKKSSREIDLSEDFSLTLSPRVSQSLCFERV